MRLQNVRIIANILLLSQLRLRMEGKKQSWYRTPRGLLYIHLAVFVGTFAFVYAIMRFIPEDMTAWIFPLAVQILSLIPLVTLGFMVLYGIFFIIGESAQYASSEMVNYMPVSTTDYVLGSSLSTIYMYLFILMAALGLSLGFAVPLGFVGIWGVTAALSVFFMVVGGFVAEIIRALVNRVSSTFSKRGGRSAILTRAVLIVIVLLVSQVFFNPNFLLRIMQWFAPQIQALWYVPLLWPSLVVVMLSAGNLFWAGVYGLLTLAFGLILMGLGVFLRSRYWVPVPVTVKLGGGKAGAYGGRGLLGSLGLSQPEVALVRKDARSLFRRKEMVRYLAMPVIVLVPVFLSFSSDINPGMDAIARFSAVAGTCLMGGAMFGLFISMISMGQEGTAIWNLRSSPISSKELFRAKLTLPLLISLLPGALIPALVSIIYGFTFMSSLALMVTSLSLSILAVMVGTYLSPKYMDLEERPRSTYIRGTGIMLGLLGLGALGTVVIIPMFFYYFWRDAAMGMGMTSTLAILLSAAISLGFIVFFYRLASRSIQSMPAE